MSDKNNPFSSWDTNWLEAQRPYMEAWASLTGAGSQQSQQRDSATGNGGMSGADLPWVKALEFWWRSVAQNAEGETKDVYGKLIDQTQAFYFLTDQLSRFLQGLAEVSQSAENWQEQLEQRFDEMRDFMTHSQGELGRTLSGMFGAWQLPMDTLQRTFSTASLFPGDFLQGIKPEGIEQVTDRFLSVPGVGYSRESQEQIQEGLRLWIRYQRTAYEYQIALSKVGIDALDIMKQRIMDMAGQEQRLTSLRELYDLWVDCNESAYADFAFSAEYSRLYGRLVNDLMALKQHGQHFVDETMSAFSMPTRKSMATMQKRQQELRRELITVKQTLESLETVADDVDQLKRNLEKSRSQNKTQSATSGAASKKKVSKKIAAKKKQTSRKKKSG